MSGERRAWHWRMKEGTLPLVVLLLGARQVVLPAVQQGALWQMVASAIMPLSPEEKARGETAMSTRTTEQEPPASAPPPKGVWIRRLSLALPLACVAMMFLFAVPYVFVDPVTIQLLPPDAVQVSASAAASGRTLVTRRITDARTVADLYARLNGLPAVRWRFGCLLAPPDPVDYRFHFTRWGMPIEDAQSEGYGCAPRRWFVSRYGFYDLHMDFTGEQTKAMLAEAQLPPLPSQP